jgi:hypothetical protein
MVVFRASRGSLSRTARRRLPSTTRSVIVLTWGSVIARPAKRFPPLLFSLTTALVTGASSSLWAQDEPAAEPTPESEPPAAGTESKASDHRNDDDESTPQRAPAPKIDRQRAAVAPYYSGFHVGIDPGVVFGNGKTAFALALRLEYGIDTGTLIIAPGVALGAYFLDPNVYVGMPTAKLVLPIGWFVPFIEGGAGVGEVTDPSQTGLALLGAGGFMIHASPNVALGIEAGYETILGTDFGVFSLGPVLAFSF